jgi:hypothetical protein
VAGLPVLEKDPDAETNRLLFNRRPRARGNVTPAHVATFAAAFPKLRRVLKAKIAWSDRGGGLSAPAAAANALARRLLGIRVDLRVGSLVSGDGIQEALWLAAGEVSGRSADCLGSQIFDLIESRVPTVEARENGPAYYLAGAAWSCDVNAALSPPEAASGGSGRSARPLPPRWRPEGAKSSGYPIAHAGGSMAADSPGGLCSLRSAPRPARAGAARRFGLPRRRGSRARRVTTGGVGGMCRFCRAAVARAFRRDPPTSRTEE